MRPSEIRHLSLAISYGSSPESDLPFRRQSLFCISLIPELRKRGCRRHRDASQLKSCRALCRLC